MDRLRQALDTYGTELDKHRPDRELAVLQAARLVLEGERVGWCEEHQSANPYALSSVCESFLRGIHMGIEAPVELTTDCRMVVRLLTEAPEDKEKTR